jgi:DNA-binding NarL/FixJ family response regulator
MAIRSPLAGADSSGLAAEIAQLSDQDRYLLALAADGWTTEEIASWRFRDPTSVRLDLRRIYMALGR